MIKPSEFVITLQAALAQGLEGDGDATLVEFLTGMGFDYPVRTATNLRLLAELLPVESLAPMVLASQATALPDMAMNNLERIAALVDQKDLESLTHRTSRRAFLMNVLGASPFLTNILFRDPAIFHEIFGTRKIWLARSESDMLEALQAKVPEPCLFAELLPILRRFKYQEVFRIAARDLNGLASLEEVTAELSALAAAALQVAYECSRTALIAEHGEPLMQTPHGVQPAEMTILGMGKLGGRELNFSSDIDIIYFYSGNQGETAGVPAGSGGLKGMISLHAFFVKQAEMISKALSQVTADGFVFRVDLGLRPEGKGGDLAVSLRAAEIYYESWGQSWERSAMLKARPVAGSIELGEQFLAMIEPFIYRKYLDYSLIEDIMAMKKKIDASLVRVREGEQNIKLGRGGIREIEFFIQALQLVYAGKNPKLRERNSLKSLAILREARLISDEDCAALSEAYRFLRTVEHRIQVVQERQTHSLPVKDEELRALARRTGYLRANGEGRFRERLEQHRQTVSAIYGALFLNRDEKLKEDVEAAVYHFFDRAADPELLKDMLAERRFKNVDAAYDQLLLLYDGPPRANLTVRARRLLEKIGPPMLQEIFASPDPDMAMTNLDRFLHAVGGRSSIYALLAENRPVLKLIISLFGMSQFLSKIFIGHPELLDSMVARTHSSPVKDREVMEQDLAAMLEQADGFEEELDVLRRYRNEEFLRVGMHDIHGKVGQSEIAIQLSCLAEVCLTAACRLAHRELARFGTPRYSDLDGTIHAADFAIISMGKLGGGELNYHSDLDIIYIYDHQGYTDGEKQLSNHDYFARLGQKLISILTTTTREGYVYKLDTRLRPSGNAGPLVTSLGSFKEYHRDEAQIWERQALTKARVVYGGDQLREGIEEVIRHTVYGFSADETARTEIHRLRMRMENEIAKESVGSYNIKTGRGGMVDVEFIVQFQLLRHGHQYPEIRSTNTLTALKSLHGTGLLTEEDWAALLNGYKFLRRLETRLRIIHDCSMNDLGGSQEYLDTLARRLGYDPQLRHPGKQLMQEYEEITEAVRGAYVRILGDRA